MRSFRDSVIEFVKKIPKGKVVSYGQVAAFCGHPKAPRQVGGILRSLPAWPAGRDIDRYSEVPWWRVINNKGEISIKGNWVATKEHQRDLLVKDGVKVSKENKIDIEKYRWRK